MVFNVKSFANGLTKAKFVLLLTCCTYFSSLAQYSCIKVGVLGVPLKVFRVAYEVSFLKHFSASVGYEIGEYRTGTYSDFNSPLYTRNYSVTNGWGIMPEIRYYPFIRNKPAPHGFFIGLHYRYKSLTETFTGKDYSITKPTHTSKDTITITSNGIVSNYGIDVGYKATLKYFSIETLIGFGASQGNWKSPNQRDKIDPLYRASAATFGDAFRLELSVGFVFPKIKANKLKYKDIPSEEADNDNSTDKNAATVIIYRPKSTIGANIKYDLRFKDTVVAQIKDGTYTSITVQDTGWVEFSAKTEDVRSIIVKLQKGRVYYLRCVLTRGFASGLPRLQFMKPIDGDDDVNRLKKN